MFNGILPVFDSQQWQETWGEREGNDMEQHPSYIYGTKCLL